MSYATSGVWSPPHARVKVPPRVATSSPDRNADFEARVVRRGTIEGVGAVHLHEILGNLQTAVPLRRLEVDAQAVLRVVQTKNHAGRRTGNHPLGRRRHNGIFRKGAEAPSISRAEAYSKRRTTLQQMQLLVAVLERDGLLHCSHVDVCMYRSGGEGAHQAVQRLCFDFSPERDRHLEVVQLIGHCAGVDIEGERRSGLAPEREREGRRPDCRHKIRWRKGLNKNRLDRRWTSKLKDIGAVPLGPPLVQPCARASPVDSDTSAKGTLVSVVALQDDGVLAPEPVGKRGRSRELMMERGTDVHDI
eukprot:scaffold1102_cov256-Pinguiococcus_pyrenoidosus.AAC.13